MTTFSFGSFLNRPELRIFWSTIVVIGVLLGIYFPIRNLLFPDKSVPYYLVLNDELLVSSPASKIKIYYDSIKVNNIKVMQIALWNGGGSYIDKEKLINSSIAKLSNKSVKILQIDVLKKSRKGLNFETKINKPKNRISLYIIGDEVLESNDGLVLKIFYTTNTLNSVWDVDTRIVGIPSGFKDFKQNNSSKSSNSLFFNIKMRFLESFLNLVITAISIYCLILVSYNLINNTFKCSLKNILILIILIFSSVSESYHFYTHFQESIHVPEFLEDYQGAKKELYIGQDL